ncbi:hypothetical protein [Nocardia jejuensis]|uniref:hypothetical protein n=1 Tax=Nocardia jejuensis TaxID=328049 RepID=UPI00082AECF6|nr:hypothetical protein [Nocardia jejuensis]
MTSRTTTRPALAGAIRAVAALTVIGSAVAVTALTVRQDDDVAAVVVSQQQPAATAATTQAAPDAIAGAPGAAPSAGAGAPAPGGAPIAGAAPAGPGASVPLGTSPGASVPLGTSPGATLPAATTPGAATPGVATPGGSNPGAAVPLGTGPGASVQLGAGTNPFAAAPADTQPACPLGWPAPKQQGGLASLIGLAPLAGPFSSEAFALGSVYQPILQLVGPVLAEIAPVITQFQPQIDPLIAQVQGVEATVLQAILPYYGPYRDQLIAAEGDFAKVLTPILTNAYNSEIASCFVAWQGQIIDQAKGGRITVASLAHPGTVVELDPKD